jgi:hypothetical protein
MQTSIVSFTYHKAITHLADAAGIQKNTAGELKTEHPQNIIWLTRTGMLNACGRNHPTSQIARPHPSMYM